MKKKLIYFMAITAGIMLGFSSCSKEPAPAEDVAKSYTGTELTVKNSGIEVLNGNLTIIALNKTTVELQLSNIVNGQAEFKMEAQIVENNSEYSFSSTKDIDGMKVDVKGTIINGKANVTVAVDITSAELTKAWTFNPGYDLLMFNLKTKTGKLIYYGNEEPEEMDDAEYSDMIPLVHGSTLSILFQNFSLTFDKNGYVGVKCKSLMSPEGQQDVNIPMLARYYYNPKTKVLLFDAPLNALFKSSENPLSGTHQVPFNCTFTEDGKLEAVIDPNFIAQFIPLIPADIDPILSLLDPLFPEQFQSLLPPIKGNIKTIINTITDKDNFVSLSIGGRLVPVTDKQ